MCGEPGHEVEPDRPHGQNGVTIMGMRHSDATFLRREVLPLLFSISPVIPDAQKVVDRIAERLHDEETSAERAEPIISRWHKVFTETGDLAGWHITLTVDDHQVPYITGFEHEGEHAGLVSLTLDRRYGIDTTVEDLDTWAPFLANAMAVSAGRTSHGPNSYVRNPHGRSGAGDPPELIGTLLSHDRPALSFEPEGEHPVDYRDSRQMLLDLQQIVFPDEDDADKNAEALQRLRRLLIAEGGA